MRYALVNGEKTEPQPKLRGVCPTCHAETVSRCGEVRIHHWSHRGALSCDPWWEKETEWHRSWKDNFSKEWQEIGHVDEATGERHIADVKTADGLIIEFQHSSIKPDERRAREQFYKRMVWVVDGCRLERDFPRFLKGKSGFEWVKPSLCLVRFYDEYFPKAWLKSPVPVIFDFRRTVVPDVYQKSHESLWCLLPAGDGSSAAVALLTPDEFVTASTNGTLPQKMQQAVMDVANYQAMLKIRNEQQAFARMAIALRGNGYRRRYRRF